MAIRGGNQTGIIIFWGGETDQIARLHNISHIAFSFKIPHHALLVIRHDDTCFAIDFYYLYKVLHTTYVNEEKVHSAGNHGHTWPMISRTIGSYKPIFVVLANAIWSKLASTNSVDRRVPDWSLMNAEKKTHVDVERFSLEDITLL